MIPSRPAGRAPMSWHAATLLPFPTISSPPPTVILYRPSSQLATDVVPSDDDPAMVIVPALFVTRIVPGRLSFARRTASGDSTNPEHAVSTSSVHSTTTASALEGEREEEEDSSLFVSCTLIAAYLPRDGRMQTAPTPSSAPSLLLRAAATTGPDGPNSKYVNGVAMMVRRLPTSPVRAPSCAGGGGPAACLPPGVAAPSTSSSSSSSSSRRRHFFFFFLLVSFFPSFAASSSSSSSSSAAEVCRGGRRAATIRASYSLRTSSSFSSMPRVGTDSESSSTFNSMARIERRESRSDRSTGGDDDDGDDDDGGPPASPPPSPSGEMRAGKRVDDANVVVVVSLGLGR